MRFRFFPLKRAVLLVVILLNAFCVELYASHIMGGEITWTCQGGGQFIFKMKLYRDCNGVSFGTNLDLNVDNHPVIGKIPVVLVSSTDISPVCNGIGPSISCAAAQAQPGFPNAAVPIAGAVQEFIYESAPILLNGPPPAQGWIFSYTTCCRNPTITNLNNPAATGFTIRAVMYPFNATNTNPCYDNSPEFLESPKTIICTGYPFSYNHNAVDAEQDSLAYSWASSLGDTLAGNPAWNPGVSPMNVSYAPGFSANSPMPGVNLDPNNIPATINPLTGEITYTSFTQGNFITCVKVEAWKCGQLVAEIYREMQVVLLPCGSNGPPVVPPPLNGGTTFSDTVVAGTLVNFTLSGTDFDLLPNNNPQTLTITASGNQFGTGFTNAASGCLNAPCATLAGAPPVVNAVNASTVFTWQTDCAHVGYANTCAVQSNTYNFIFKVQDDFCPAPAQKIATISITVLALPMVPSPNLHCLAVQPNGDVVLTWDQPVDTVGTFNSYQIFSSTNPNGPFTVVDSVFNYNQLTYTHVGANANAGPVYYTVQTRSGCNGMALSPALDTMSTIFLQVLNNNNGTATLQWNNISNPPPTSQFGSFLIYKEYPAGVWTLIDSTTALTFLDTVNVCNALVNYRVEIYDTAGCWSVSNIDGDVFQDLIIPVIPSIDSVSVDANGNAILGWQPSTSGDVVGYVVYQFINNIWTALDTVFGLNNTSYINLISNADQQSEQYVIAAFDSCGNISAFSPTHNTILLSTSIDICNETALLTWNVYNNMSPSVAGYSVYVSENNGPLVYLGTNPANDQSFDHPGLNQLSTYCYYVLAFNAAGTISSTSNESCVYVNVAQAPLFQYLRVATVTAPGQVLLNVYVDNTADVQGYEIQRKDSATGTFATIGFVPFNATTQILYYDNTAETEQQSYYYRVVAIDSCGAQNLISNIARTIFCEATANNEFTNTVRWNDYGVWSGGTDYYNIYRSIDGVFDPIPIASVPYQALDSNTYIDDVSAYSPSVSGLFTYYIDAVEGNANIYGFSDSSRSNVAEAMQKPLVFVPNAFTPNNNGQNDVFIPSTGFIDLEEYKFDIFDRWGENIFTTTDRFTGWDGKMGGNKCQPGIYVWTLTFRTSTGQFIDMKGTVALIR